MRKSNKKPWQTNRQQRLQPRLGLFWCSGCDCNKVSGGQKCKVCGHRQVKKRLKK